MTKRNLLFTTLVVTLNFSLSSCQSQSVVGDKKEKRNNDTIVIIFDNVPKYSKNILISQKFTVENTEPTICYYDNYIKSSYEPRVGKVDTLYILPNCEYIMLSHKFNTLSSMQYLIRCGETITYTYKSGIPTAKISKNQNDFLDLEYENLWRMKLKKIKGYTPFEIYQNPVFTNDSVRHNMIINSISKIKSDNYLFSKVCFTAEQIFLDSLFKLNKLSDYAYQFYSNRRRYLTLKMNAEQMINLEKMALPDSSIGENECVYNYYFDYVAAYTTATIEKKSKIIPQSNGQISDYREVFEKIDLMPKVPKKYKALLLHKYLGLIANHFSTSDFDKYYKRSLISINDSFLLADIRSRFLSSNPIFTTDTSNLYLSNLKKNHFILNTILSENKGKVIYIDFWASWCAPCRATMKKSNLLRSKFSGKAVTFLYISIDNDFSLWVKANKSEKLDGYINSFIALNQQTSSFLKKINLISIPRYLLFDKAGVLVNNNAPNPSNIEAEKMITKLLQSHSN